MASHAAIPNFRPNFISFSKTPPLLKLGDKDKN
jgi:hypothetical protein